MKFSVLFLLIAVILSTLAAAQTAPSRAEFEVASIRPVASDGARVDIGMHIDGAQARFNSLSLRACMRIAWDVKNYQLSGPDWYDSDRFNITAKLPQGTPQEQVREMLKNLLLDRFRITVHREKKDFAVYALKISKTGLRLKQTPPDPGPADTDAPKSLLDVKGSGSAAGVFADLGNGAYFTFADNRLIGHKMPVWRIADLLSTFMDKPVVDMTGLKPEANYEISLEITAEDYRTMQIRGALNSGIGLPAEAARLAELPTDSLSAALAAVGFMLDVRKAPLDVIVIDHADKTPIANQTSSQRKHHERTNHRAPHIRH